MKLSNVAVLAMGIAVLMPGAVRAKNNPVLARVEGTITAINRLSTPPTVTILGKTTVTLNVTPATKLEVGEVHASLASLAVGGFGEAKFDPTTRNAVQIEEAGNPPVAAPAEREAIAAVVAADPASSQIMLDANGDGVTDATLIVTLQTEIKLGAARLSAAQLALLDGLVIKVEFNSTTFVVRELTVDISGASTLTGTLASFDPVTGTLVLNTATGPVTLTIPMGADLRVGQGGLAAVPVGSTLQVLQLTNGAGTHIGFSVTAPGAGPSGKGGSGSNSSSGHRGEPQPGDDRGGHGEAQPGDDHRKGLRRGQPEAGDDRGTRAHRGEPQAGNDRRSSRRRGQPEAGDDRGARKREAQPSDDHRKGHRRSQAEAGDDRGARARKGEPQPADDRGDDGAGHH